jgi:hypothetical protein
MAMWVLRTMLGLDIPKAAYADLRYLIAGLFNTWFFLLAFPGISAPWKSRIAIRYP